MQKNLWFNKTIFCILASYLIFIESAFSVVSGDRIVLEVDRVPYTQRQIEVYYLVKNAISSRPSFDLPNAKNWQLVVKDFVDAMLLDQSNLALGLFRPNANAFQKANENFSKRQEKNSELRAIVNRLALRHQELQRVIVQVFRIESTRQSKNSGLSRRANEATGRNNKLGWLAELRAKSVIRFYDDAAKYQEIRWPE